MKRYIKPQIQVMATVLTTEMLAGSLEGAQLEGPNAAMSKKNPGLFDDEWESEKESHTQTKPTINSVWE